MTARVLLVEPEEEYLEMTAYGLRRAGFEVIAVSTARMAREVLESSAADVVILDDTLGDISGVAFCRSLRSSCDVPIFLLSRSRKECDILEGFAAGADDILTKPFSIKQLTARLEVMYKRYAKQSLQLLPSQITIGQLAVDLEARKACLAGRPIQLTRQEFLVLYLLATSPGQMVSLDRLIEFAWEKPQEADPSLLRTLISRVRKKLGTVGGTHISITSVPKLGYILEAETSSDGIVSIPSFLTVDPSTPLHIVSDMHTNHVSVPDNDAVSPSKANTVPAMGGHLIADPVADLFNATLARMEETLVMIRSFQTGVTAQV